MTDFKLTQDEISSLKVTHRTTRKKREADRIKTIILLGTGWSVREVAEVLMLDDDTIRNYLSRYKEGKLELLLKDSHKGYGGKLSKSEIVQLDDHLNNNTYGRTQDIVFHVSKHFKVKYSISGMRDFLHRIGYAYKKPKLTPP
ncbi:helix-turn-helix domain-containing protein, partial [Candidatus Scalindua japonica]